MRAKLLSKVSQSPLRAKVRCQLIGFVDTFGKVLLPQAAGVLVYVLMALILLWKPDGLFKA